MKIAIVVPSGDMIHKSFAMCLVRLVVDLAQHGHEVFLPDPRSSTIQKGRTVGIRAALAQDPNFILFIDSDQTFPSSAARMLMLWDKSIVGATYPRRNPPIRFVGKKINGRPWRYKDLGNGLQEAKYLGCGMMLIGAHVFYAIEEPWFHVEQHPEDDNNPWTTEDQFFCQKVRGIGHSVHCDTDLSLYIGHLGTKEYTADDVE